ncbi:MAG: type II toxin-antitoxin system RelE/ParE family toxin, partial [Deltaproteobacteria bacterium]|nr:type II toxin-antitoxin system RelE/ParE family toxin [Deltaproteobacteria bacterium]
YADENGKEPFVDWLNKLRDVIGRKRVLARLARLEQGNYGDCVPVGEGVSELRMFFGTGYRVYFGEDRNNTIVLLCGGDKGSQVQDIKQAKAHWQEYLDHEKLSNLH